MLDRWIRGKEVICAKAEFFLIELAYAGECKLASKF